MRDDERATFSSHALVVSNDSIASRVGRDILSHGGNAVDAAVATGYALAVTYPFAGNIGGGGFMIIRMADGSTARFDPSDISVSKMPGLAAAATTLLCATVAP